MIPTRQDLIAKNIILSKAKHLLFAFAFLAVIPAGNLRFARSATHAH